MQLNIFFGVYLMKKIATLFLICLFACGISFADPHDSMARFTNRVTDTISNACAQQNVYADAWIGKLFPALPPHFAVGFEGGITNMDLSDLCKTAGELGLSGFPSSMLYPTLGINAKIGGLFLPFDIGFSFFTLDTQKTGINLTPLDLEMFVLGGNFRFAILQGKGLMPVLSVGVGYYYSKGAIGKGTSGGAIKVNYDTQVIIAETQLSKKFIFVTPFIGFRGIFSSTTSEYNWRSAASTDSKAIKTNFGDSFIPQVFGGVGLSLGVIKLDANACYDFVNTIWSFGVSLRFGL